MAHALFLFDENLKMSLSLELMKSLLCASSSLLNFSTWALMPGVDTPRLLSFGTVAGLFNVVAIKGLDLSCM